MQCAPVTDVCYSNKKCEWLDEILAAGSGRRDTSFGWGSRKNRCVLNAKEVQQNKNNDENLLCNCNRHSCGQWHLQKKITTESIGLYQTSRDAGRVLM